MSRLHGNGIVAEGPDLEKTPRLDQIRIAYENQFVSIFDNAQPGFAAANECFASPDTSLDTVAVQSYPTPPARDNRMLPADKHPWKNLNVSPLALKPAPTRPGIMYDGPPGCSSSHEARDLYVSRYGGMTALDLIQMNSQLYNYSMRVGGNNLTAGPSSWYWTGGTQLSAVNDDTATSTSNAVLANAMQADAMAKFAGDDARIPATVDAQLVVCWVV